MDSFFAQGFGILFVLCLLSLLIDKLAGRAVAKPATQTGAQATPFTAPGESEERK